MDFDACWKRVREKTDMRKQTDLAAFLNISDNNVTKAKKRGRFPEGWAIKIANAHNLSTDWILSGKGPATRSYEELPEREIEGKGGGKDCLDVVFDLSKVVGNLAIKLKENEKKLKAREDANERFYFQLATVEQSEQGQNPEKLQIGHIEMKDFPFEKFAKYIIHFWKESDQTRKAWLSVEIAHLQKSMIDMFPEFQTLQQRDK